METFGQAEDEKNLKNLLLGERKTQKSFEEVHQGIRDKHVLEVSSGWDSPDTSPSECQVGCQEYLVTGAGTIWDSGTELQYLKQLISGEITKIK